MSVRSVCHACCPLFLRQTLDRIEGSPLAFRFARGAFWSLAGALVSRGLGLGSAIVVARLLGKSGFGELGIIQSTVGMFGTFAGFGLGVAATRFIAEFRTTDAARAGRVRGISSAFAWITSSLTAAVMFAMAPWIAAQTLAAPHLTGFLRVGTLYLLISSLNGAQTGVLAGFESFRTAARVNVWSGLASFPLLVGGVYWAGLGGALWGMVLGASLNWVLNHIAIRRECAKNAVPYSYRGCWQERAVLWKFCVPAFLGGVMTGPVMWAASAILVNQADGYAEMGVYNAILRVKQVPEMILGVVMAPILPILSQQYGSRLSEDYSRTLKYAFQMSMLIMVPFSLIQMAAPSLTLLPYGKEYQGHYGVVQWLMLQTLFIGCFSPFGSILSSMNRMWFGFTLNLMWGALLVLLSRYLVPLYRAAGLAAAFTVAHFIISCVSLLYLKRIQAVFHFNLDLSRILLLISALFLVCFIGSISNAPLYQISIGCSASLLLLTCLAKRHQLSKRNLPDNC